MALNIRPAGMSDEDTDSDDEFFFRQKQPYNLTLIEQNKEENVLHEAVINGRIEELETILSNGSKDVVNKRLRSGWTILMNACFHAKKEIVKLLLDKGADPNLHSDSVTPIMVACSSNSGDNDTIMDIILNLIDKDCLLNIGDKYGQTPLMRAISSGRTAIAQKLLDMHVNIESRDVQGWTPLFWAVHHNQPEILELLISRGARMNEVDKAGRTLLDIAYSHQYETIIEILSKHLNIDSTRDAETEPLENQMTTWFDYYPGVTKTGQPTYYAEIPHLLFGMNCEQVEPKLRNSGIDLRTFLLLEDSDMTELGIHMQFQRNRLKLGLHNFHKRTWKLHAVAGLFAAKNKDFSVLDCLTALGSHLQQIYILEATMQYSMREYRRACKQLKSEPPDTALATKTSAVLKTICSNISCIRKQIKEMKKSLLKISAKNPEPADLIKEASSARLASGYLTETVLIFSAGLFMYHAVNYFTAK